MTEQAGQSPKIVATPVRRHEPSNILLSVVLLVLSLGATSSEPCSTSSRPSPVTSGSIRPR